MHYQPSIPTPFLVGRGIYKRLLWLLWLTVAFFCLHSIPVYAAAPIISGTPPTKINAGNAYSFTPSASDADGDALTFSIVNKPVWAKFNATTGQLSGTPTSAQIQNYTGIRIQVTDKKTKVVALPTFSIAVVNVAPMISGTPLTKVAVGQLYSFTPVASDENHDALTFSIVNKPTWAVFDTKTGKLSGKPTVKGSFKSIVIKVSDGKLTVALAAFSIDAVINTAPKITGKPDVSVPPTFTYRFVPAASDADKDTLTFSITNKPAWADFNLVTGELSGRPSTKGVTKGIVIRVSDGKTSSALPVFSLAVQPNTAPVISGTPATTVEVGNAYSFTPTASDVDKDALTFLINNQPLWATFDATTGTLSGTPTAASVGTTQNVTIQVSDGTEITTLAPFNLSVTKLNHPPVISGTPSAKATVGTAYSFTPTVSDVDNDTLTFSISNKPTWASFDTATGKLSGAPTAKDIATTANIVIQVSDGKATASLTAFSLQVVAATATCNVNYKIASQWSNGFSANVTLTNLGDAWKTWTATWTMPNGQTITGLWNGTLTQTGSAMSVKDVGWNGAVSKNASVQFGFNGTHTGTNNVPTNVTVNGVLCSGNPPPPPPPVVACEVKYSLVSEWDTGLTADVYIKNTGDTVSDWTVAWDMPDAQQITGMWNGVYKQTNSHVDVTNGGWNRVVNAGAALQFGFNGTHQGANRIPGNITLNGVKCAGQVDPPPLPLPACDVKYRIQKEWGAGFTASVDITNTGAAWNGWKTTWTMPTGQVVTQGWNALLSQTSDKVTALNLDSNKLVRQNGTVSFGFNGSLNGFNVAPIDLAVNGTRCSGQSTKLVIPPNAPSQLQANLLDNNYVDLTWQDNSSYEDNMVLERRENGGSWAVLATLPADAVSYSDKTLTVGVVYDYHVKAVNTSGSSDYTSTVSVKRQDRTDIKAATLVNNCAACHSTDGYSAGPGVPSIAGLSKNYLVKTMKAYRTGERYSSVMSRIAKGYTDTQIDRMADYLSQLTFKAATQTTVQDLVNRGKAVHESNCMFCHAGTGNDPILTGTRLDGQQMTYLYATLEDYYAGRSSNIPTEMANQMKGLKTQFGDDVMTTLAQYYAADATTKAGGNNGGGGGNNGGGSTDPKVAPAAPTGLTATVVENSKASLAWQDNSGNETGFRVERRVAGTTAWSLVATLGSNVQTYNDAGITMGMSYDYRVSAFNAVATVASNEVSVTLLTALKYGESQYQRQGCASCHGADGKGGFTKISLTKYTSGQLSALTKIIHDTMPPGNPGACTGGCASSIASYILDVLVPAAGGGGGDNTQTCVGSPPSGVRSLRLLTRLEYQNTVNDLLGLSLSLVNSLPDENQVSGFDNNIVQNQVSGLRMDAYLAQAEKVAAQGVLNSWSKIVPCTQQDTACARQFIQTFGKRAFRRPLTTAEVDTYAANFSGTAFKDAVEQSVMAMLVSPNFLYRSELGELQADGTYKLTPYEVASSLSYLFWGSMPDDVLFLAADQNALDTPAQRISQASRLLSASRSRTQVGNFVGQWLLKTSPYSLPAKDATVYPAYTAEVKAAMSQELINFFNYVTFDSTQSFHELYTADYVVANKTLADFYKLTGPSGTAFEKTPVTDGSRTGLLTLGAVLARYANSNESHPFKRGRFFFERILCHELPEPANFGLVQPPDPDPNMTTRQRFDFHSKAFASCYSCHQYLDGPGFGFENYDGAGQFRKTENGNVINAGAILRGLETYSPTEELTFTDLNNLSQVVSDSPTAAQCVARQYYRYTTGHLETTADQCALDSYLKNYSDNGYNLQTMLISIVNAPNFTLRRAQ